MIRWQEAYSTGISKLDEQHINLFQYSNELEMLIKSGEFSMSTLKLSLKYLERYALGHFGQEETCMHKFACPIAQTNQGAHQQFIQTYTNFQNRVIIEDDCEATLKELHRFLETWLKEHICRIDVQLKKCLH